MRLPDPAISTYVARWAPSMRHLLSSSDVQAWRLDELLALADPDDLARWGGLDLGYADSRGDPLLRAEIAGLYASVATDEVLCFAGIDEAIFVMVNVMAEAGDRIVAVTPAYGSLHAVARGIGADLVLVPLDEADGWRLPVDALREALDAPTRLVILNWPHNPTGALPDAADFHEVLEMAARAGARVLCDEAYRFLERDPRDRLPAAADASEHAVSLGGLSKAFGLAGLRIGWAVGHDTPLLARAAAMKDYLSGCGAAPSQVLGTIALRARDTVLARSRRLLDRNFPLLEGFLREREAVFYWVPPRAGSTGFVRLAAGVPAGAFASGLRDAEGVLVLPGAVYGTRGNHVRIGFGVAELDDALHRVGRFTDGWGPTAQMLEAG